MHPDFKPWWSERSDVYMDYTKVGKRAEHRGRFRSNSSRQSKTIKKQSTSRPKKLTYNEQRELAGMEKAIEEAERTVSRLTEESQNNQDPKKAFEIYHKIGKAQEDLEDLFSRWQELENKSTGV
jgi:hypothetical protein